MTNKTKTPNENNEWERLKRETQRERERKHFYPNKNLDAHYNVSFFGKLKIEKKNKIFCLKC
jgi:hypothetical protein